MINNRLTTNEIQYIHSMHSNIMSLPQTKEIRFKWMRPESNAPYLAVTARIDEGGDNRSLISFAYKELQGSMLDTLQTLFPDGSYRKEDIDKIYKIEKEKFLGGIYSMGQDDGYSCRVM